MPKCRASCSASRPERPFRMPTAWSFRRMSFTSKPPMKCTTCFPWCRKPVRIRQKLQNSAILILILAIPRSRTIRLPTGWTTRNSLKNSAGMVWSAATAPTSRRPTKTAWNTRSAWSRRWAIPTTTSSSGTMSTTPRARASRSGRAAAPVRAALQLTAWASPTSTPSATT